MQRLRRCETNWSFKTAVCVAAWAALITMLAGGSDAFAGANSAKSTNTKGLPPEVIEADISTRTIAVTSDFSGKEVIVFGSIHNSRQEQGKQPFYDVVVVVEGAPQPLVLRRKGNVAGLWMNTTSVNFDRVPSFYALSSTRALEQVASPEVFADLAVGFKHIRMSPRHPVSDQEYEAYRDAIIRLKKNDRVYVQDEHGVEFKGQSLFRSSVTLPANVPVGSLFVWVYLFHDGEVLAKYTGDLLLEREGLERWLHNLAHRNGFLYGILAIITAMAAGLAASEISRRRAR